MKTELAIDVSRLRKSFSGKTALDGIDLSVPPMGSVFALLGPNGAGKSTLVAILTTLLRADGGTATVGGFDVGRQAAAVRNLLSVTSQASAVDEFLTGRENLTMIGRLHLLGGAKAAVVLTSCCGTSIFTEQRIARFPPTPAAWSGAWILP